MDEIQKFSALTSIDEELTGIICQVKAQAIHLPESQRDEFLGRFSQLYYDFLNEIDAIINEISLVNERIDYLPQFVNETNEEFERLTGLTKTDSAFLIFAASLQVIRQLIINKYKKRLDDQEAADKIKWHNEEHSKRGRKYYATIEEIKSNPVPFDAIRKEASLKESGDSPKLSGFNHRYKAIGHDPILGLIFGTANIMTNTISVTEGVQHYIPTLKSYHVHTGIATNGSGVYDIDKIYERANTVEIFSNIYQRIKSEDKKGWKAVGTALAKEIVHLLTDIRTQKSLPLPFVSLLSPRLSQILNYAEIDALTLKVIGKEAGLAALINFIIATIHSWCYDPEKDGDKDLYSVRTKKIVQYSGEIALASTVLQTAVRIYLGDISDIKYFDFGGSAVSLYNTWNSPLEIAKIKGEYLIKKCKSYIEQ